ncbi:hypothetical protein ACP70R_042998 [Stipagrostis hirtigluma subsp. patula]
MQQIDPCVCWSCKTNSGTMQSKHGIIMDRVTIDETVK